MNAKPYPLAVSAVICVFMVACGGAPGTSVPASTIPATSSPAASASPASLLPDGIWEVELTTEELIAAGSPSSDTKGGVYRWTLDGSRARISVGFDDETRIQCDADASATEDGVRFRYREGPCGGEVDIIDWVVAADGLHLSLVETNAPFAINEAYLETKPWQRVDGEANLDW